MKDLALETPVAMIIFNRPDLTQKVFLEISKVKPKRLLVISDGPRPQVKGENDRVMQSRSIINNVDWECSIELNYSDINLGCKKRVSSGIDWVFSLVPEAIILEDDCLPEESFFYFCQELLCRYRDDPRIGMIGGTNFLPEEFIKNQSYYFTKYSHIWGWATWANRWNGFYDVDIKNFPSFNLKKVCKTPEEEKYWQKIFSRVFKGGIDTWDYQWTFANWQASRVNILPTKNLISNIGFGDFATHTNSYSKLANMPTHRINFPLTHPTSAIKDAAADKFVDKRFIRLSLYRRIVNKIMWKMSRAVGSL